MSGKRTCKARTASLRRVSSSVSVLPCVGVFSSCERAREKSADGEFARSFAHTMKDKSPDRMLDTLHSGFLKKDNKAR